MNVDDLFGPDNSQGDPLKGVTRENARRRLAVMTCPRCGCSGGLFTFNRNMHVGVTCRACGRDHPFGSRWLPSAINAWKRGRL